MNAFNQDDLPSLTPPLRDMQRRLRDHRFDGDGQLRPEIATTIKQLTALIAVSEELDERLSVKPDQPAEPARHQNSPRLLVAGQSQNVVFLAAKRNLPLFNGGGDAA